MEGHFVVKITDLQDLIVNFSKSNMRSLLIDGPWGCGKTYQIREFLNNSQKEDFKIYYISLFGMESVDEINTKLFRTIYPKKFKVKKIATISCNLISKAISPIPVAGSASGIFEALGYLINVNQNKDNQDNNNPPKNNIIIVFDDLERVDEKLSYISLLGYINSLFFSQARIIAICSSHNIVKENKKAEFQEFKEKVFDRICVIDESDKEIIINYFSKFQIKNLSSIIGEFGDNLRNAQKTKYFFEQILNHINNNNINYERKISSLQLLLSCYKVIEMCFTPMKKIVFSTEKTKYSQMSKDYSYDTDVKVFGENIANGLHSLFKNPVNLLRDNNYSRRMIEALLNIFLFDKYDDFDNIFGLLNYNKDSSESNDFLNNKVYFLSDENKEKYVEVFLSRLYKGELKFDETNIERFSNILRYTHHNFTEDDRDKIIGFMFRDVPKQKNGKMDIGDSILFLLNRGPMVKNNEALKIWSSKIENFRNNYLIESFLKKLKIQFESNNFEDLEETIRSLENNVHIKDNKKISSYIVDNDFLLPDLSKDMSDAEWNYSHEIAKYSKKMGVGEKFKKVAVNKCAMQPDNRSLNDRFQALIEYHIDPDFNMDTSITKVKK